MFLIAAISFEYCNDKRYLQIHFYKIFPVPILNGVININCIIKLIKNKFGFKILSLLFNTNY
jgi:hypothetical protein